MKVLAPRNEDEDVPQYGELLRLSGDQAVAGLKTFSGAVALGAAPASAGLLRVSNNGGITARNAANSADIQLMRLDTADKIQIRSGIINVYSDHFEHDGTFVPTNTGNASHPFRFRSTGSTLVGPSDVFRKAMLAFYDTKTDDVDNTVLEIHGIQTSNAGAATIKKTGITVKWYTLADNGGDTSAGHFAQFGGGYGLTAYKISSTNRGAGLAELATEGHAAEFGSTDTGACLSLQVGGRDSPHAGQGSLTQINNVFGKGHVIHARDGIYDDREAFTIGQFSNSLTNAANPTPNPKYLLTLEGAVESTRQIIRGAGQASAGPTTLRAQNERWRLRLSGATGGTFTLTFGANTTSALAYDATPADVQAALEALASIGAGNVRVTGGQVSPSRLYKATNGNAFYPTFQIEFIGTLASTDVGDITGSSVSLTGTSPAVVLTKVNDGVAGGAVGGSLLLNDSASSSLNGGMLMFGAGGGEKAFAAIKGLLANGTDQTTGDISFATRASTSATTLSERLRLTSAGVLRFFEGINIQTGTTTGTKIGTATTQKIGFYNATPVVQPSGVTARAALETLGLGASLVAEGGSSSLTVQATNSTVLENVTQIDFIGAGVSTTINEGEVLVTIPSGISVYDENVAVANGVTQIDFQGAGVTATWGGSEVVVTIPGASSAGGYTTTIGNGSLTTIDVAHGLGTKAVTVALYETGSPYREIEVPVERIDTNTVRLYFATAPTSGQYTAVVQGGLASVTNAKGFINHGAVASTARPVGYASVEWMGSVQPANALANDTWVVTP